MTKPTTEQLATEVATIRAELSGAHDHLKEAQAKLAVLAEQMPTLPQMADLDMVIADLRTDSVLLRHAIYLLAGREDS